jgi:flagellar hook-length control protein FliK
MGSQALQTPPEQKVCTVNSGGFNQMLDIQLKLADENTREVTRPEASSPPEKESGWQAAQDTKPQRVSGEADEPPEKMAEKDSKCDSSAADGQENGIAGILEGIGLLGLTDQQESPAGETAAMATEGAGPAPQEGEIWNISARMPEKDMVRIFSANLDAQAVQAQETGQAREIGQAACPLENISNSAQAAQKTNKEVDRLATAFDEAMARAAEDRPPAEDGSAIKLPADVQSVAETEAPPASEGQTETDADALPEQGKDQTDAVSPHKSAAPHAAAFDGAIRSASPETPAVAQERDASPVAPQQMQENLSDIAESIRIRSDADVQEFEVTLRPENLGKLQISLVRDDTGISAALKTGDRAVRQMLQPQMEELQRLLKDKGVPITKLEVVNEQSASANGWSGQQNAGWQQNAYAHAGGQRKDSAGQNARANTAAIGLYGAAQGTVRTARSLYSSVEFQA